MHRQISFSNCKGDGGGEGVSGLTFILLNQTCRRLHQESRSTWKFKISYFMIFRILLHTYVSISSDFVRENSSCFFFKICDSQTELSNYFGELMKILNVCKNSKISLQANLWFTAYLWNFMIQTFNDLIW